MDTFQILNGDLVLTGGAYTTLTGSTKVQQDLAIYALTPYGFTRSHPRFGSILESYIGNAISANTQSLLRAEFIRLINNYQSVQVQRLNSYLIQGKVSPYGQNTLIRSVKSITIIQTGVSNFIITVVLLLMTGRNVTITNTLSLSAPPSVTAK
jgi:phage baseplate assembly protein W